MFFQDEMEKILKEELRINQHPDLTMENKVDRSIPNKPTVIFTLNRNYAHPDTNDPGTIGEDGQVRMLYEEEKLVHISFFSYTRLIDDVQRKHYQRERRYVSLFDKMFYLAQNLKRNFPELGPVTMKVIDGLTRGFLDVN